MNLLLLFFQVFRMHFNSNMLSSFHSSCWKLGASQRNRAAGGQSSFIPVGKDFNWKHSGHKHVVFMGTTVQSKHTTKFVCVRVLVCVVHMFAHAPTCSSTCLSDWCLFHHVLSGVSAHCTNNAKSLSPFFCLLFCFSFSLCFFCCLHLCCLHPFAPSHSLFFLSIFMPFSPLI